MFKDNELEGGGEGALIIGCRVPELYLQLKTTLGTKNTDFLEEIMVFRTIES